MILHLSAPNTSTDINIEAKLQANSSSDMLWWEIVECESERPQTYLILICIPYWIVKHTFCILLFICAESDAMLGNGNFMSTQTVSKNTK